VTKTVKTNLVTHVFHCYEAMVATGRTWRSWTPPSHRGYTSAGRALASMTRKGVGEHWGIRDGEGRRSTQHLAAYCETRTGRWHPMYEV